MYINAKNGELKNGTKDIYKWSDEDLVRNYINNKVLYKMADTKDLEIRYQNRYTICRIEMIRRKIQQDNYGEFYKNA